MADSNTETAAPAGDSGQTGSEFSKPTGEGDGSVWEKHFGGDKSSSGKTKPSGDKRAEKESRESDSDSKASARKTERESKDSSKSTKESSEKSRKESDGSKERSSTSRTGPKDEKAEKDSTESTGPKTAEGKDKSEKDDPPADPEAPSKKARDLYAEAKKAEDPREARKLYKRAMKEAFGEVPEEFDDSRYAAVRKERKAATAAIEAKAEKVETRIKEAADRLKPAIFVMRKLEEAQFAQTLTVPLVEKTLHVMRALKSLEDGDFTQLAEVVSRASGVDHDEAMKRFVRGVKISPEGRASRQAAEEAARRAAAADARVAELERKLQERETTQTEAQKKADHDQRVKQAHARYLDDIQTDLDGHAVLQLPRGAERVLAYIKRTADPKLRSATMSFAQAADKIVASERRRLQGARHLLDEGDPPPREERERPRLSNVSRSAATDSGVRSESAEARFDYFFDKHASAGRRGR